LPRKNPDPVYISIHVRRTDYSHHLSVLYNKSFVDNQYFENATNHFRRNYEVNTERQLFGGLGSVYWENQRQKFREMTR